MYMTQVSGRLCECSATLKIFRPHLLMSSRSWNGSESDGQVGELHLYIPLKSPRPLRSGQFTFDSSSSWSVLTPKRLPDPPEMPDVWLTFLTPLICVIIPPCCCCCCWPCLLFLSLDLGTGHGISNSFCLSVGGRE